MGAAAAIGGALKGAAGIAKGIQGVAGAFGGGGGGADPLALYNAQVAQAKKAAAERQKISDGYFGAGRAQDRSLLGEFGDPNSLLFNLGSITEAQRAEAEDLFGARPNYYEVDFEPLTDLDPGLANRQLDVTLGNIRNFRDNDRLADATNAAQMDDAEARANFFDPQFMDTLRRQGKNAALASAGILPTADVEEIARRRGEMTGLTGTAGTGSRQTARDLGISQLQLQTEVAPQLSSQIAGITNSFLPPQLRDNARNYQTQVGQAQSIAAADNQFEAGFDREEKNLQSLLEAMPDPALRGLFDLQNALRAQQFAVDFGLANGEGVPGTFDEKAGGFAGTAGRIGNGLNAAGNLFGQFASILK